MKKCSKCKIEQLLGNFYKNRSKRGGFSNECKACVVLYKQSSKGRESHRKSDAKRYRTIIGYLQVVFKNMKNRCCNPNRKDYKNYGGRGIKICFNSSEEFVDYVVNVLQVDPRELQIDRINNDGNYEPGNIRFVSRAENNQNKGRKELLLV